MQVVCEPSLSPWLKEGVVWWGGKVGCTWVAVLRGLALCVGCPSACVGVKACGFPSEVLDGAQLVSARIPLIREFSDTLTKCAIY